MNKFKRNPIHKVTDRMNMLGHKNIQTTMFYIEAYGKENSNAVRALDNIV